jgi:hypothetical protein
MPPQPNNEKELFEFYYQRVLPLYAGIQNENKLANEVLFEIHAAFNHLSRHWIYEESEKNAVEKAFSHLKRSCLDIIKLFVKKTINHHNELLKIDTSIIDNGDFDEKLHRLINKIKTGARDARIKEGMPDTDGEVACFDLWDQVYSDCEIFDRLFYNNPKVEWARKKNVKKRLRDIFYGFVGGVLASLAASYFFERIQRPR